MTTEHPSEFVAECFWAGVSQADLRALDERLAGVVADLVGAGEQVRYLGSLFMRADEVVLCVFEGPRERSGKRPSSRGSHSSGSSRQRGRPGRRRSPDI